MIVSVCAWETACELLKCVGISGPENAFPEINLVFFGQFQMASRGRGSVINMSSVASSLKGLPNRFAYGTTKAAVVGMTKALAVDLVSEGVRVNCVLPGTVETPSWW